MQNKIFHDTIHGSILIPIEYCHQIIDTIVFQRLRRIEQTSMRSLYPCAHHDRFVHSIGVFHLGCQLIENLKQNISNNDNRLWKELEKSWPQVTESYKIACLLHDVGHAPFSHTFEIYFDYQRSDILNDALLSEITSEDFKKDFPKAISAKQHEKISAYIAASYFNRAIRDLKGNIEYVARMIIGCKFFLPQTTEQEFVNCMIEVLHGEIDVDRLDYALRDQWAAGFSSSRLNIAKFLRSIVIIKKPKVKKNKLKICFYKGALDQIEALVQIKNFQKRWILNHQNILYDQYLLKKSIEELAVILGRNENGINKSKDDMLKEIFNIDVFRDHNYMVCGHILYLLTDDTLIHLLRQTLEDNPYAKEWLSRSYSKKPLWKSEVEYNCLFKNRADLEKETFVDVLKRLDENIEDKDYCVISTEYESYNIPPNRVFIYVNGEIVDYSKDIAHYSNAETSCVNYLYISKEYLTEEFKKKIIENLQSV